MTNASPSDVFDVTLIGAGPSGLFGAFYAGLREMRVKVIDALPQMGGQLIALYPEKMIYDTPGFTAIRSKELVANLVAQAAQWKPALALGERALHLTRAPLPGAVNQETCWRIETDKAEHLSRTVVLTVGIGAFEPAKLANESVTHYEGRGVSYLVQDLQAYAGKRVLIIGGGDSAVDWALALEPLASAVSLIHRREGFRAHDSSVNTLMSSRVDVKVFYELRELQGDGRIERAVIFDNRTQETVTLPVDEVILALGFKADLGPIREWGLETIGRRYIKVNNRMETNLPGVYAAGDVALQEDETPLNLIVTGYGQVTVAVNYAYTVVRPGGKVFPGHSSERSSAPGA
ncbi:MAG: ferredoxin--NADP(+) reductase [Gammaproteobacteria bacterium RBG_16_66_13]|nr:MAG: ferredoxin--NADP(+) reductase [Gammaproteobacteria bacterium RBG_16_66_13]